jgi:hypothetical protein
VALGIAWILAAPTLRRRLGALAGGPPALVALQAYRVVGGSFLLLLLLHRLPAVFAAPAGIGDVLIGVTAIPVAASLGAGRRWRAVTWNLLGLLDLIVAVTLGVLASPALHLFTGGPSINALTQAPVALVPTFMVPLSILLHVASLRSLGSVGAAETGRARALRSSVTDTA